MISHYGYYRDRKAFIAILAALLTTIGALAVVFFLPDNLKNNLTEFSAVFIVSDNNHLSLPEGLNHFFYVVEFYFH
jgi:hypothetical protein